MKSKSLKFKLITFVILSVIAAGIIITSATRNRNTNVITNKVEDKDNKNEILKNPESVGAEASN